MPNLVTTSDWSSLSGGLQSQRKLKNLAHVVRHINVIILIDLVKI
jgi:hypothetical protein